MQAGPFVCELDCEEWGSLGAVIPIKKAPLYSVNTNIQSKEGEKTDLVHCCLLFTQKGHALMEIQIFPHYQRMIM